MYKVVCKDRHALSFMYKIWRALASLILSRFCNLFFKEMSNSRVNITISVVFIAFGRPSMDDNAFYLPNFIAEVD